MKYGIALCSKHTGERTVLGSQFATLEERQAFIDKEVCTRCNRTEVVFIPDDHIWLNRHAGFRRKTKSNGRAAWPTLYDHDDDDGRSYVELHALLGFNVTKQ